MSCYRWNAMSRRPVLLIAAVLAATLALPATAQWKWRDGKGQTQYSDLPPPSGISEKDILQRPNSGVVRSAPVVVTPTAAPAAAASAPTLTAKGVEPELEAKRKKQEADEAEKKKAEEARLAAARAENCTRARSQMRSLESGVRIARTNEKGEREILDDKQIADETRRAREVVTSDCK
jgi:hypothetical protein